MISVIVPVHNAAVYLADCIKSVLDQTYSDFELLLIDDGSTDESGAICDSYAKKDKRVKVVHNKNHGVSYTRNVGLALSVGEYIAFCDADDQYKPNYLMDLYHAMQNSGVDMAICNYSILRGTSEKVVCSRPSGVIEKEEIYRRIFIDNTIGGFVWNKFFKKELLQDIRFDENMQICEDTYFVCRFLQKARKIEYVGEPLYLYRVHGTNTMNDILNVLDGNGNMKYAVVYEQILQEKLVDKQYENYVKANGCALAIGVKCDYLNTIPIKDQKVLHQLNEVAKKNFISMLTCKGYAVPQKLVFVGNALFNIRKYKGNLSRQTIQLKNYIKSIRALYYRIRYFLLLPGRNGKSSLEKSEARELLVNRCPIPDGTVEATNTITNEIDLSIIVPAYNVEQYIEKCVVSILEQKTKYKYELIIVDDGSTDKTAELLRKFENNNKIKIIHQENRGFSGARNRGLEKYNGRYLMFVDSDDYLFSNAIERLLDAAYETSADIVEGAAISFYNDGKLSRIFTHASATAKVNPMHEMMGYPWGKVYKSEIFQHIKFPEHYLFEDTIIGMLIYPAYHNCWVINDTVYAYRVNMQGITQSAKRNNRSIESQWITEYLLREQSKRGLLSSDMLNCFLDQVAMNYSRAKALGQDVREALFVECRELYHHYFANCSEFQAIGYKRRTLQKCFIDNNCKGALHLLNYWYYLR